MGFCKIKSHGITEEKREEGYCLLSIKVVVFTTIWSHAQMSVVPGVITGRNNEQS